MNWTLRKTSFDCQPSRFFAVFQIKKDSIKDRRSPFTPTHFILYKPSCHNQSKALDISKKNTSNLYWGLTIKRGIYFMGNWKKLIYTRIANHEAWMIWIKQFVYHQVLRNCVKKIFSKSLLQIGKRETGW